MNKKVLIFFSILLILISGVSVASPTDDLSTDLDDEQYLLSDADETCDLNLQADSEDNDILKEEEESYVLPSINIETQNILVGQNAVIKAKLTDENDEPLNKNFNISVYKVDANYDDEITILPPQTITGNGTLTLQGLENGTYHINAVFKEDDRYMSCSNNYYFLVKNQKETPYFDIDTDGYYTDDDQLDFYFSLYDCDNNIIFCAIDIYINGVYTQTIHQSFIEWGCDYFYEISQKTDYEFKLVFKGDDAFNPVNHTFTMHPREKRSYINIKTDTVVYGSDAVIEVTLYDNTDEINQEFSISIFENTDDEGGLNLTYTATGSKTITIDSSQLKNNATYTVIARYEGNSIYTPCESEDEFKVSSHIPTEFYILNEKSVYRNYERFPYAIGNQTKIYYKLLANGNEYINQYIDIYLNNELFTTITSGYEQGEIIITGLKKGLNIISFVFNGTDGYSPCNYTFNITSYEKQSKIVGNVPYVILGNDVNVTLRLTDGKNLINDDFLVELYKGQENFAEQIPLATYTIHNGTDTITIPSTLLKNRNYYTLLCFFKGNENCSIRNEYIDFFAHDTKKKVKISIEGSNWDTYTNSTTISFKRMYNGESLPSLVDFYLNGVFQKTLNYTEGTYSFTVDGLRLGENTVKLSSNETEIEQSAVTTIKINYALLDTYVELGNFGRSEYAMWEGIQFYFRMSSVHYFSKQSVGSAEIYINSEKYATVTVSPYDGFYTENVQYVYHPKVPGQYNITVHYLGDNVTFKPSWSENMTFTLTESGVNTNVTAVLENMNSTSQIRIGEYINLYAYLKNTDNQYLTDYMDIYINGTKLTSIFNNDCFKFMPSEVGVYNFTVKFEGNELYPATGFSNPIIVTVKEATKPATLNMTINDKRTQGEFLEVSYTLTSEGEVIYQGDESNYVEIFINSKLVSKTDVLTGTIPLKLTKAGNNYVTVRISSDDKKYEFRYRRNEDSYTSSFNVEANPEARTLTNLTLKSDSNNYYVGDSIIITHALTNISQMNCPDELESLVVRVYNEDLHQEVSSEKINYYLNGEFIGYSYVDASKNYQKYKFTFTNTTKYGWYNFTAVLEDGENIIGSTGNLSVYINAIPTQMVAVNNHYSMIVNSTKELSVFYLKTQTNKYIYTEFIDVYINGVKNATLGYYDNLNFTPTHAGEFNITGVFKGSEVYGPSSKTILFTVDKIHSSLSISTTESNVPVGTPVNLNIALKTLTSPFSGFVDIYVNDVLKDTVYVNGACVYQFIPETADTYTIYGKYNETEYYRYTRSDVTTITPEKLPASIRISTAKQSYTRDEDILIKVDALYNGKQLNRGIIEFDAKVVTETFKRTLDLSQNDTLLFIPYYKDGRYSISATYKDNIYSANTSNTIKIDIEMATTYTYITSNRTTIEIGSDTSIQFETYGNRKLITEGRFEIYVNNVFNTTLNLNESNIFKFSPNSIATYEIYGKYCGNSIYRSSKSDTITVTVNKISTSISIDAETTEFEIGSGTIIGIDAVLNASNTRLVDIYINGAYNTTIDMNTESTYTFIPDTPGTYDIQAKYNGTDIYSSSESDTLRITVKRISTSLDISTDKNSVVIGDSISVRLNLTSHGETLSKSMTLKLNSENIEVQDSYVFTAKKAGTITLYAVYEGDEYYNASTSQIIQITVNKKAAGLIINASAGELDADSTAIISIDLSSGSNILKGEVLIIINGIKNETINLSETSTYMFSPDASGNYSIMAIYHGNDTYSSCQSNVLNIVFNKIVTRISSSDMTVTAIDTKIDGEKGPYLSAVLKDAYNNVLVGKTVKITLNKQTHIVKTDSKGIVKVQLNIKNAGNYMATIVFEADNIYKASSATASIKVNKQKPKITAKKQKFKRKAKTKKVKATLKTSFGKALKGKKLIFQIKNKKYTAKTNSKGIAKVKVKLTKKGKYICKIRYKGDGTYKSVTKRVKITVK